MMLGVHECDCLCLGMHVALCMLICVGVSVCMFGYMLSIRFKNRCLKQ